MTFGESMSDVCEVTFIWRPGINIRHHLERRGVPTACLPGDDRPRSLKHPNAVLRGNKKSSRNRGRDSQPLGYTSCSNLQGDYSLFHHSCVYLFHFQINFFYFTWRKTKCGARKTQMVSERIDNDSRSSCEWVTSLLVEESDYCNTELTISTEIIPFLTRSSNCIMSHCILHMLSKSGFRYANYLRESEILQQGQRKTCSRGAGVQACHFVKLLRERDGL